MRNNFLKRVLGITVVTVLSVSFLAGCGAAEEKNEQVDVVSSEPAANSEEVSEEEISETVSTERRVFGGGQAAGSRCRSERTGL